MMLRPGIIVTSPDSSEIRLIAETELAVKDMQQSENDLKQYMRAVGCPIGLLVTPAKLRIYNDQYLSDSLDSIQLASEFDISNTLNFRSREPQEEEREFLFEQKVQSWLERLASNLDLSEYERSLQEALRWYVVPALLDGTIQAGGPRYTSRTPFNETHLR